MKGDPEEDLLDISAAAHFLNVSETSLRRWTNEGRLVCMRVGQRRERRFRRSDLLAFLEGQGAAAQPGQDDSLKLGGVSVGRGSHICGLYDNDLGRLRLAVPFLADGLRNGDLCILVAAAKDGESILEALPAEIPRKELVTFGGLKTGREQYDYLERTFVAAVSSGVSTIRIVGDMAWSLANGMPVEDLIEFETRVDQIKGRFPVAMLCQYDVRKFSGPAVLSMLRTHPDTFRHSSGRFIG